MRTRPAHLRFGLVAALLAAITASTTATDHSPDDVLARLGHDDWAVRQKAWRHLLADQTLTDQQIDAMFAAAQTCEQRRRLIDVAYHHTLRRIAAGKANKSGKACLGVSLQSISQGKIAQIDQSVSHVTDTHPGLPGFIWFVPGDIVLAIDGKRPSTGKGNRGSVFLVNAIASHKPGDVVAITVRRDGLTFDVPVKLVDRAAMMELYATGQGQKPRRPVVVAGQPPRLVAEFRTLVLLKPEYLELWQQRYRQLVQAAADVVDVAEESAADTP